MEKMYTNKGAAGVFGNLCRVLIFLQMVACDCGNKPGDDKEKGGKPRLTLTGPTEVKGFAKHIQLEVTADTTVMLVEYFLAAEDVASYDNNNYTSPTKKLRDYTSVLNSHRKNLWQLSDATTPKLDKDGKASLTIPVTWSWYYEDTPPKAVVPFSQSAEFRFSVVNKEGEQVADPIEVKWTCAAPAP